MTPQMVEKARNSAARGHYANVEFKAGVMEHLPLEDNCMGAAISNCVINHSPDKLTVFRELYRVLKPGGRIAVSDLVVQGEFQEAVLESLDAVWRDWIAGAAGKEAYLSAVASAGFRDIAVVFEREFGMSPMDERLKGKIISLQVKAYK
jgi:ubiquinone/menaquinone biosynthesis C-methylase UbiE